MENITSNSATLNLCEGCFNPINLEDVFCDSCGYPLKGSEMEQKTFMAKRTNAEIDLIEFNAKLKIAGNTLFYLSGLFIVSAIFAFFSLKDDPDVLATVIPYIILGVLFLVLGEYSKKKPLACIICGLCLYVIVQLLLIINNPGAINFGYVIKLVIIGYLVKGIKSAIDIERIKKEHNLS